MRTLVAACLGSLLLALPAQPARSPAIGGEKPLPDIAQLMQQVISKQRASEASQQDYLVQERMSVVEGIGRCDPYPTKFPYEKTGPCLATIWIAMSEDTSESEVFWLRGLRVSRLVAVSGFDHRYHSFGHNLSPEELHRQNGRIDDELAQAAKARATGEQEVTGVSSQIALSRLLELGTYRNARRGNEQGRSTIMVDYIGGACASSCKAFDSAARFITGTVTLLEEYLSVTGFEGIFTDNWAGAGAAELKATKGTTLEYLSDRLDGGTGFPKSMLIAAKVSRGRSFNTITTSRVFRNYRKFRITSTILPDFALVPDQVAPVEAPHIK